MLTRLAEIATTIGVLVSCRPRSTPVAASSSSIDGMPEAGDPQIGHRMVRNIRRRVERRDGLRREQ